MGSKLISSKNYSRIRNRGLMVLAAVGIGAGTVLYSGCSKEEDNIVNVVDCHCVKAFDLCADVSFKINYVKNSLPGVKDIIFKKTPNDDCGYISDKYGNLIGREEPWQVMSVVSDSADDPKINHMNDSLADIVRQDIVGAVILNKVWLKDSVGNNASIIADKPYSATRIEVDLDAREIPDTSQWVVRNGKKIIPGVGGYVRSGNIEIMVKAYGEERSSRNSTYQSIKIEDPTLMDYKPR